MKKVINFWDNHRIILVLSILLIVAILFLGIKSLIFINYKFEKLECDSNIGEDKCYVGERVVLVNPMKSKKDFWENHEEEIDQLRLEYELPDFSMHTAYFYEIAALLDWKLADGKEEIYDFFKVFCDTFSLEDFYQKNIVFYDIFYPERINLKLD